jgi:hypothetical protein
VHPTELPLTTAAEAIRVARALGAHRYVAGRLLLVHALAFDALATSLAPADAALEEALRWARYVLQHADIDAASKDERLFRAASPEELSIVLSAFWTPGARADGVHERLMSALSRLDFAPGAHAPFDEAYEDDVHPALVDAGWELHPLSTLDIERHRGAIESFGDPIYFEAARFEEESAIPPPRYLQELPVLGPVELLRGADGDGQLVEPLVLWTEGNVTYHDYVIRGVLRAAKVG